MTNGATGQGLQRSQQLRWCCGAHGRSRITVLGGLPGDRRRGGGDQPGRSDPLHRRRSASSGGEDGGLGDVDVVEGRRTHRSRERFLLSSRHSAEIAQTTKYHDSRSKHWTSSAFRGVTRRYNKQLCGITRRIAPPSALHATSRRNRQKFSNTRTCLASKPSGSKCITPFRSSVTSSRRSQNCLRWMICRPVRAKFSSRSRMRL